MPKFMELQTKLYGLQPDLFDKPRRGKKSGREAPETSDDNPQVIKLQRKIASIENDVLFDRAEAEYRWKEKLDDLRKEAAFSRQTEPEKKTSSDANENKELPEEKPEQDAPKEDVDDAADLLGDMFQGEEPILETGIITEELNKAAVTIRDFGKWTGLNPRRVLEETCRARYGYRFHFVASVGARLLTVAILLGIPHRALPSKTFLLRFIPTARQSK